MNLSLKANIYAVREDPSQVALRGGVDGRIDEVEDQGSQVRFKVEPTVGAKVGQSGVR